MARKVLISFLGTNDYIPTHYRFENTDSPLVRFVQEAIIDQLCKDWTSDDKIYIFLTETARTKNWLNYESRTGLEEVLKQKSVWPLVESVEIHEGISEDEIWRLFNDIYTRLQEEDQVYFDVTHAFRSIPMFATVLMNYAKFTKNISVESVLYGAFEKLGSAADVRRMKEDERIAPIIDLTSIVRLQNLTQTASDLLNYGKIGTIGRTMSDSDYSPAVRSIILQLKSSVEKLEEYIILNRADKIKSGKVTGEMQINIKRLLKEGELNDAEREILTRLYGMVSEFGISGQRNLEVAIKWAIDFDMVPQAYTLGQENIKDLCLQEFKTDFESYGLSFGLRKEIIEGILGISERDYEAGRYTKAHNDDYNKAFEDVYECDLIQELRRFYIPLKNNRNNINHARENRDDQADMTAFKSDFVRDYYNCLKILKNASEY